MAGSYACTRWAVRLSPIKPTVQQLCKAVAFVQPEERLRLMKFVYIDDFMLSLVGRLLMRKFVSESTDIPYNQVKLERDEKNKPYWLQPNTKKHISLSFNTSHQGQLVVLGGIVGNNVEPDSFGIGVDVAKIEFTRTTMLSEYFRLMQRTFTAQEWKYIKCPSFNEKQQVHAFMRLWALKEAYTKERGMGIYMNLQQISFDIKADQLLDIQTPMLNTELYVQGKLAANYEFEEHLIDNKYCVALAFRNKQVLSDNFTFLEFQDLLVESDVAHTQDTLSYCQKVLLKDHKSFGIYSDD